MKTALVTGASSGIGRATSLALGERGFHVVAAGRSRDRTRPVVEQIKSAGGSAEFLDLDLASLDHVRQSAEEFEGRGRTIDVLVNNAGVGLASGLSQDGFEMHFAVNHLGHFALNWHLRRAIRPGARIVTVASSVHKRVDGIDFDSLNRPAKRWPRLDAYGVSKLANILYVRELARRQPNWHSYAVHPGFTSTNILPWWFRIVRRGRLNSAEEGAETVIWCAVDPDVDNESGGYYARLAAARPSPAARDDQLAKELWVRSEQWCGINW